MQRSFKLILFLLVVITFSINVFAQDKVEYKDVMLDGKPAKLNVATGEVTFVNPNDKKQPVRFDDYVAKSNKATKTTSVTETTTGFHVVQEGETLLDISKYYNITINKLKKANNLETTLINKGQVLRVKNIEPESSDVPQVNTETTYNRSSETNTSDFHIVKSGETLYSLAKRYNISLSELKSINNINSNIITVGQRLRVNNFTNTETTESADYNSTWTVSKGDTLFSIAKKNGTTVNAIKQLNGLTSNVILVGQKLQIK